MAGGDAGVQHRDVEARRPPPPAVLERVPGSHEELRDTFVPLFERYGVQVVFSGHEHDYERSNPINGVIYIVTGAASRTRRTGQDDFTAVAYSTHHFVDLNVFDDHLLIRAIDQDGEQFDEVVVPVHPAGR